ncbi:hypothetical protein H4219_004530, partial [Mycoemilia scoparia]
SQVSDNMRYPPKFHYLEVDYHDPQPHRSPINDEIYHQYMERKSPRTIARNLFDKHGLMAPEPEKVMDQYNKLRQHITFGYARKFGGPV